MLLPIRNKFRSFIDISGFWNFKIDKRKIGEEEKWFNGFETETEIAVPGSWNEQLEELGLLHYIGTAWYLKKFFIPSEFSGKKIVLRFNSVDYNSRIWLNGKLLGENTQGFLPFEFDITDIVKPGEEAFLVASVNNELSDETIPQGITTEYYKKENRLREETFPPARFDFSPFGGIHRPVIIYTTPDEFITKIKVDTKIGSDSKGFVKISCFANSFSADNVEFEISDSNIKLSKVSSVYENSANTEIVIDECRYWSNKEPHLYDLNLRLRKGEEVIDSYHLQIGVREVRVTENKFYLNNEEVFFKGFGKHEDFAVIGKGLFLPQIVKDFELLKWINANSFRTSHYPYSDEIMHYADRKGILVIDEVPAVSLDFRHVNEKTLENHKYALTRLIERDYNHPCVVMWAAGNEPNLVGEKSYFDGRGRKYWKEVFEHLHSLDTSRPATVPNCTHAGTDDPVFEFSDVLSINRYYGWYEHPGDLEFGINRLSDELDLVHKKYNKPVFMTEFGADTIQGFHSTSLQMFTEEYQSEILKRYIELIESKDYSIGEHVWNFADFRTPLHFRRVILNLKGVFSRDRQPKLAAFTLKELWKKKL
ncbi:MAG: beta-glucuronidase [Melioribacteraceae bacterium]